LSVVDVVAIMLFALHDMTNGARGGVLTIVVQTTLELPLFALAMGLVDVVASVAVAPVLSRLAGISPSFAVFRWGWSTSS
jgi:hypothetical protein